MLALVDESGDVGIKFSKGSSRLFAVTAVLFKDDEEARNCSLRIDLLRRELRLPKGFEFHFHQNKPETKIAFLKAIAPYDFSCYTAFVDQEKLDSKVLSSDESLDRYVCCQALENAKPYLKEATVIIDGKGNREYKRKLQQYLKKRINDPLADFRHIRGVRVESSEKNNLLQLADMVSGAIYRSLEDKQEGKVYCSIISHHVMSVETIQNENPQVLSQTSLGKPPYGDSSGHGENPELRRLQVLSQTSLGKPPYGDSSDLMQFRNL